MEFRYRFEPDKKMTYRAIMQIQTVSSLRVALPLCFFIFALIYMIGDVALFGTPLLVALTHTSPFLALMLLIIFIGPFVAVITPQRKNPLYWQKRSFLLNENGLELEAKDYGGHCGWSSFYKIVESKDFILFFISSNQAHFLPKALIRSEDELMQVREFIHMHYDKAKLQGY